MATTIVTVNATITQAPSPSTLQGTGALISQGGTNLTAGTYALLSGPSSLATYYLSTAPITSMTWSGGVVTVTTTNPHGFTVNDTLWIVISGVAPSSYNGTFLCTVTGANSFTYVLISNPGSVTTEGSYQTRSGVELSQMNNTYWAQGSIVPVYVLELGPGNASDGVTALEAFISNNNAPQFFYSYLVPRYWDGNASFLAMIADYESPSSKTYFFVTTTLQTYLLYTNLMKCVLTLVQAPALGVWPTNVITELLAAPAAPALSSSAAGSLPATTYYVRITYMTAYGETPASPEANLAVAANHVLVVDSPSNLTGATGWNVYVGTTSGSETLQNSSPIAIATNWTEPTSGLVSGVAYPTQGYAVATTTADHGVQVGQWFELVGFTPTGYNNWYAAQGGTSGSTLVLYLLSDLVAESVLGSLAAGTATQTAAPIGTTGEFTMAASFYKALGYAPSAGNLMTPFAFSYMFGVTPWVTQGNTNVLAALQAASVNYMLADIQGGITDTSLYWGTTQDGSDFSWWYSADWIQINLALMLANAVINGSNNPLNPLAYSQNGINTLQDVALGVVSNAVQFNLANGSVGQTQLTGTQFATNIDNGAYQDTNVVNAVPLIPYLQGSPGDYKLRKYAGLGVLYIPQNGFIQIIVNLNISNLPVT